MGLFSAIAVLGRKIWQHNVIVYDLRYAECFNYMDETVVIEFSSIGYIFIYANAIGDL